MATLDYAMKQEFDQTVTIKTLSSRNEYGKETYTTLGTFPCKYFQRFRMVYRIDNESVRSDGLVYVAPNASGTLPTVTTEDILVLPDGDEPRILDVRTLDEGHGVDHLRITYGRTTRQG